jgi:hypothetical protein
MTGPKKSPEEVAEEQRDQRAADLARQRRDRAIAAAEQSLSSEERDNLARKSRSMAYRTARAEGFAPDGPFYVSRGGDPWIPATVADLENGEPVVQIGPPWGQFASEIARRAAIFTRAAIEREHGRRVLAEIEKQEAGSRWLAPSPVVARALQSIGGS